MTGYLRLATAELAERNLYLAIVELEEIFSAILFGGDMSDMSSIFLVLILLYADYCKEFMSFGFQWCLFQICIAHFIILLCVCLFSI